MTTRRAFIAALPAAALAAPSLATDAMLQLETRTDAPPAPLPADPLVFAALQYRRALEALAEAGDGVQLADLPGPFRNGSGPSWVAWQDASADLALRREALFAALNDGITITLPVAGGRRRVL